MTEKSLSKYVKMRLHQDRYCKICGEPIMPEHSLEFICTRRGKTTSYSFFHELCLNQPRRQRMAELEPNFQAMNSPS